MMSFLFVSALLIGLAIILSLDDVDGFNLVPCCPSSHHLKRATLQMAKEFASIGSDGTVKRSTGSLGVPKKNKKIAQQKNNNNKSLSKKERQRTANGTMDSNTSNASVDPSEQGIQVVRGNRGSKSVTIIRGMNATPDSEKKKILKSLKSKLGVGGTLVDGVLELQGRDNIEKVVDLLKGLGYAKTRKVGK